MLSGDARRSHAPRLRGRMGTWPAATTAVAGVIGDPIEHSLSPVLHNAALVELGLDWAYVAFPVPAGRGQEAVAGMGALGIRGLSVTMPHKAAAAAACHELTPVASRLGVANTVTNAGGRLLGDSTDGLGFLDSLAELGWSPRGRSCLVLGAGGAARAVVLALAEAGARRVEVVARQPAQASVAAALAGGAGVVGSVDALESVQDAELVVNATPVGMDGMSLESVEPVEAGGRGGRGRRDRGTLGYDRHNGLPFGLDEKWLGPGQLVADLIYAPSVTPLLAAARYRGAGTCNGLGMLIHQAARQVRAWTGRDAPVEVMSAAALRELRKRAGPGEARGPSSTSAAKLPK